MSDQDKIDTSRNIIGTSIYVIMVIAIIITITGAIWTFLDILMPIGKTMLFLDLNFGLKIAIVGGILAALSFLILLFYSLSRRGRKTIVELLFKKKAIPERYKDRTGIKVATGMVIVFLCMVIIGVIISLIWEFALGSATSSPSTTTIQTFTGGEIVLFLGISLFLLDGLFIFLILLWINGYYYILRLIINLEKEEDSD